MLKWQPMEQKLSKGMTRASSLCWGLLSSAVWDRWYWFELRSPTPIQLRISDDKEKISNFANIFEWFIIKLWCKKQFCNQSTKPALAFEKTNDMQCARKLFFKAGLFSRPKCVYWNRKALPKLFGGSKQYLSGGPQPQRLGPVFLIIHTPHLHLTHYKLY